VTFDLGRVISRAFGITWRHRWLWLLGVFGGAGVGGNYSYNTDSGRGGRTSGQVGQFMAGHIALVLAVVAIVLVIVVVAFVVSCIAVPASIWAGLQLDAGRDVTLGTAWRQGRARGWRYFRLALLKGLISLGVVVVVGVMVALGAALYAAAGSGIIPLLVIGGILLVLLLVAALIALSFGLLWSDRMLVILELGAADSIRAGWWLVRHEKGNTFLFAVVFGIVKFVVSLAVLLAAAVIAIPGIILVIVFFTNPGATTALAIVGFLWLALLGGGAFLVGAGFVGALTQVGYAIAGRDLAIVKGMQVRPEVIGWDPYAAPAPAPAT
jgi:hypothetical protein